MWGKRRSGKYNRFPLQLYIQTCTRPYTYTYIFHISNTPEIINWSHFRNPNWHTFDLYNIFKKNSTTSYWPTFIHREQSKKLLLRSNRWSFQISFVLNVFNYLQLYFYPQSAVTFSEFAFRSNGVFDRTLRIWIRMRPSLRLRVFALCMFGPDYEPVFANRRTYEPVIFFFFLFLVFSSKDERSHTRVRLLNTNSHFSKAFCFPLFSLARAHPPPPLPCSNVVILLLFLLYIFMYSFSSCYYPSSTRKFILFILHLSALRAGTPREF